MNNSNGLTYFLPYSKYVNYESSFGCALLECFEGIRFGAPLKELCAAFKVFKSALFPLFFSLLIPYCVLCALWEISQCQCELWAWRRLLLMRVLVTINKTCPALDATHHRPTSRMGSWACPLTPLSPRTGHFNATKFVNNSFPRFGLHKLLLLAGAATTTTPRI